ncbi:hypothetical protein [Sorangium sp. So ce861]|uniref:hypothetical protein n=1 Tax=Sorangium sp. So ce861 TaxID=3133323 RepID=UPI003F6095CA
MPDRNGYMTFDEFQAGCHRALTARLECAGWELRFPAQPEDFQREWAVRAIAAFAEDGRRVLRAATVESISAPRASVSTPTEVVARLARDLHEQTSNRFGRLLNDTGSHLICDVRNVHITAPMGRRPAACSFDAPGQVVSIINNLPSGLCIVETGDQQFRIVVISVTMSSPVATVTGEVREHRVRYL